MITERRADYSRFQPILKLIKADPNIDYDLVVTGMHLKGSYGRTIDDIKKDGFKIFSSFEMFNENEDSGAAMTRAYAEAVRLVTYELERSKPDIILSGFDIAANAAVTLAGAHMNIPVAHIQGGEVTGTIDESIRHAMSKFAHYHFAANDDACNRLIKMGERPECVFNVGCPSIDALQSVPDNPNVFAEFGLKRPYFLVIQHPVTTEIKHSGSQIECTISALLKSKAEALFILPNNDAGYSRITDFVKKSNIRQVETLSISNYVNLLRYSNGLIGNSSSGIHEAATFDVPVVNIGSRQQGRLRPQNVIDVGFDVEEILCAMKECTRIKSQNVKFENPYGEGDSAPKIVKLLKSLDLSEQVIQKRITY